MNPGSAGGEVITDEMIAKYLGGRWLPESA
jgi:hypothetical protein